MATQPEGNSGDTILAGLQSFIVLDVQYTGVELGRGAYGSIYEVKIAGALCASKQIHDEFLREGTPKDIDHLLKTFEAECLLLSNLRHPNIVQFLGISNRDNSK